MNARVLFRMVAAGVAVTMMLTTAVPPAAAAPTAREIANVQRIARFDPRAMVQAAAWSALFSRNVDAAVARFVRSDYADAQRLAARNAAVDADFARRVLATHTAEFAPEVHAAAQAAMNGTDADREVFARAGYAAAKERDRRAREAAGEQAASLVQADRDFVALLRDNDPGEQVRAAAALALRPAATDADLVDFFAHDWVDAAALDLYGFRIRCTSADMAWRARAQALLAAARTAEQAALDAAGDAAVQARAAAARAWAAAGEQTGPARVAWAQAQQTAEAQAANWRQVAQAAGAAAGPNWQPIADGAQPTAEQWAAERENAAEQAAYWQELLAQALAGEQRMRP